MNLSAAGSTSRIRTNVSTSTNRTFPSAYRPSRARSSVHRLPPRDSFGTLTAHTHLDRLRPSNASTDNPMEPRTTQYATWRYRPNRTPITPGAATSDTISNGNQRNKTRLAPPRVRFSGSASVNRNGAWHARHCNAPLPTSHRLHGRIDRWPHAGHISISEVYPLDKRRAAIGFAKPTPHQRRASAARRFARPSPRRPPVPLASSARRRLPSRAGADS